MEIHLIFLGTFFDPFLSVFLLDPPSGVQGLQRRAKYLQRRLRGSQKALGCLDVGSVKRCCVETSVVLLVGYNS